MIQYLIHRVHLDLVSQCVIQRVNQSPIQTQILRVLINSTGLKNTQKIWIILLLKNMIFIRHTLCPTVEAMCSAGQTSL